MRSAAGPRSRRIAPGPARRQIDVDAYVRKFPHMWRPEIQGLENLFCTWDADGSGEITLDEMAEMLQRVVRDLFDKIDLDGSGSLSTKEIKKLVEQLGQNLSDKEFKEAMNSMDRDGSGQVSFSEFEAWWKGSEEGSADANTEELGDLFAEVDSDGSGAIDVDEFITMIAVKMESKKEVDTEKQRETREPMTLVRLALQSVRDDVRAIYGMAQRPKTALQAAQEMETVARNRRCFWTTENIGRPACVRFRKAWDGAQVFLLGYIAIAVPYRTGFNITIEPGSGQFWFEVVLDIYFAFDIFLNFRTGYRTDEGDLIVDPKAIRQNYFATWFAIDVAACFPLTYIELLVDYLGSEECTDQAAQALSEGCQGGGGFGAKLKAMKIARLLRLAKMLRLAKLRKVVKQIDEHYSGIWTVSKLFSLIVIILYVSHIFACMWYFAGSSNEVLSNGGTVYGWVHRLGYDPKVDYVGDHEQFATGPNKWPEDSWFPPYLDAYYYAITTLTTVGYGDRTPHTDLEKIFSIISELAGGITFGILAGTLSAMLTESNAADLRAEEQIDALKTFMTSKRVNKSLRRQITDQMEYFYKTKSVFDEAEIVEKLPPKFKKTLLLTMYKPQLQTCPLFAGLDESIITKLAVTLRPYLGVEGDTVVREGEVGDEMY
eukprot:COSAG02_NODE_6722_length_3401_cov_4.311932_1_plen_657_part_10